MILETHIQVSDIPEEGLFLNFEELADQIPEVDRYCSIIHASGRLELHKSGAQIRITGWIKSRLVLTCHRCLGEFNSGLSTPFFYLLKPSKEFLKDLELDHKVDPEEIEVYWYEDGQIRAEELFREQILLQLPMRILCKQDCKGLCPGCGVDLNNEECLCGDVQSSGPFSILAKLKTA